MAGLAARIDWETSGRDPVADARRMLEAAPHRCVDGATVRRASPRAALGHGRFQTLPAPREADQPACDPQGRAWITADARIDNRRELARRLAGVDWLPADPPDALLILAGYEVWGDTVADQLEGDFAFAIWDEPRGRLLAARDPINLRPLFYHEWPGRGLAIASEPTQLLALDGVSAEPDPLMVGEFLTGFHHRDPHRSEFRAVHRLPGGHTLVAEQGRLTLRRFWSPEPASGPRWASEADCREEFVALLRDVVRDRLAAHGPVLGLVSGGYDSAAIAAVLDRLQRDGEVGADAVELAYRPFGGLRCDESHFIEAVLATSPFPRRPIIAGPFEIDDAAVHIGERKLFSAANPRHMTIALAPTARAAGARVVLRGDGGDQLFTEGQVDADLLSRGLWAQHLKEVWHDGHYGLPRPLWRRCRRLAGASLRLLRRPRPAPPGGVHPPSAPHDDLTHDYLTRDCRRLVDEEGPPPGWPPAPPDYPSLLQRDLWTMVTGGIDDDRYIETLTLDGHFHGIEYRAPLYDVRLIRFMLDVPFEWRIPNGVFKAFLTRALAGLLPEAIVRRNSKTRHYEYLSRTLDRWRGEIVATLFDSHHWHSGAFVDRESARRYITGLDLDRKLHGTEFESANRINLAWHIAAVELWLRGLEGAPG